MGEEMKGAAPSDIAMINVWQRIAITEDGQELPVTHCFDSDGDECDPEDAVAVVAGPDRDGRWLQIDMTAFEGVPMQ
jgi:hypothetical protein